MPARAAALFERGLYLEALIDILLQLDPSMIVDVYGTGIEDHFDEVVSTRPDAVLVDVEGDEESGVRDVQLIAARLGRTRVVAVGRGAAVSSVEKFLSVGAAGYLPKSFTRTATLAVLRVAIGSSQSFAGEARPADRAASTKVSRGSQLDDLGLTEREVEVLALAAQGKTNSAISRMLGTAEGTVRIQMSSILSKLNVANRGEAIAVALRAERVVWEQVRKAESGNLDLGPLLPYMEHRTYKAGHVLFRKDDIGNELYYLQGGRIRLPELDVEMSAKELFGELGLFASSRRRTSSAICVTDVDVFVLSEQNAKRLYFLNPSFAIYMMNLVAQRLVSDRQG